MTMLEDALREAFATKVAEVPAVVDPAGTAICRARVLRRRHRAVTGTAVVMAIALVMSGTWWIRSAQLRDGARLRGTTGAAFLSGQQKPPALPVDLFDGVGTVYTAGGRSLSIPDAAPDARISRVPAGWLYPAAAERTRLLRTDGTVVDIDVDSDRFVTSADGSRIAWVTQPALNHPIIKVAKLTPAGVTGVLSTAVPVTTVPVAVIGGTVVLSSNSGFDTWDSTKSSYQPTWNAKITGVYGSYGDMVLGTLRGSDGYESGCLALLTVSPSGLHTDQSKCDVGWPAPRDAHAVSPDHQLLAAAKGSELLLLELPSVFMQPTLQGCQFGSDVRQVVWLDNDRVLAQTDSGWGRCELGADGPEQPVADARAATWSMASRPG